MIKNYTKYHLSGINKLIKLQDVRNVLFYIYYVPENIQKGKIDYRGFTEKFNNKIYKIYLAENLGSHEILNVLCHEFIHIKQYQDGRLRINGNIATFEGLEYDMLEVDYNDRPWEIEAIKQGRKLKKRLNE